MSDAPQPILVDARGRRCPYPVIALAKAATRHGGAATFTVLSDDPASRYDVPAWCTMTGAELLSTSTVAADADTAEYTEFTVKTAH